MKSQGIVYHSQIAVRWSFGIEWLDLIANPGQGVRPWVYDRAIGVRHWVVGLVTAVLPIAVGVAESSDSGGGGKIHCWLRRRRPVSAAIGRAFDASRFVLRSVCALSAYLRQ
jgi:hypothetical protein